jgi:hypothetical protein
MFMDKLEGKSCKNASAASNVIGEENKNELENLEEHKSDELLQTSEGCNLIDWFGHLTGLATPYPTVVPYIKFTAYDF